MPLQQKLEAFSILLWLLGVKLSNLRSTVPRPEEHRGGCKPREQSRIWEEGLESAHPTSQGP